MAMTGSVKLQNDSESDWHGITYHFEKQDTLQIDSPADVIRKMSGATVNVKLSDGKRMVGFANTQGRISNLELDPLVNTSPKQIVLVQVTGGTSFRAEVEVAVQKLDPAKMPLNLAGVFTKLPLPSKDLLDTEVAKALLHSDRTGGGSSHTIWFHGNRTGYQFNMTSGTALDFTAVKV